MKIKEKGIKAACVKTQGKNCLIQKKEIKYYCPGCGHQVIETNRYCWNCGFCISCN